jgi:hypothetical protein
MDSSTFWNKLNLHRSLTHMLKLLWSWILLHGVFDIGNRLSAITNGRSYRLRALSQWLPALTIAESRRISAWQMRRVAYKFLNSELHRGGESLTMSIADTQSRWLPAWAIRGVINSPHWQWVESPVESHFIENSTDRPWGESLIQRLIHAWSLKLHSSLIQGVDDSPHRQLALGWKSCQYPSVIHIFLPQSLTSM